MDGLVKTVKYKNRKAFKPSGFLYRFVSRYWGASVSSFFFCIRSYSASIIASW